MMTRAIIVLSVVLAACGGDDGAGGIPPRPDAPPRPRDPAIPECTLSRHEGDPLQSCIAEWDCPTTGAFILACGDNGSGTSACVCVHDEDPSLQVDMVPQSCTDPTTVTDFAKANCGWSFL